MVRGLFALVFTFAFLSSEAAVLLGVDRLRMAAFAASVLALAAVAMARAGGLDPRAKTVPALLALLLGTMALRDLAQDLDPLDYKLVLPVLVLLAAPDIARALGRHDPARLALGLLAGYVTLALLLATTGAPGPRLRGYEGFVRYDFTGSLVAHSGLCLIFAAAGATQWRAMRNAALRAAWAGLLMLAVAMLLLAATRTVIVTLALLGALHLHAAADKGRMLRRLLLLGCSGGAVFLVYTVLVSDAFFLRLFSSEIQDFSSGRAYSQLYWLGLAAEHPLGLGLGAVRDLLEGGRPALDGDRLLEWPHNEWLRLFIEGGIAGVAWLALLVGWLARRTLAAARAERDPLRRSLMLAILADMIAQSLLQNYFNGIYYATAMVLTLAVLLFREETATGGGAATGPSGAEGMRVLRQG
ncbi:hypothetical protein SH611_10730 [Geminicoccaceae bacterium 1502E]|nr:hypothetical protein [Geminicoccaceae bacterium 1502E]